MSADGTRLVYLRAPDEPNTLVVVDASRRTYLGISRDGSYWHVVRPARLDDPLVGDGKAQVGTLVCNCAGGTYGQRCYWTKLAESIEKGDVGHQPVLPAPEPAGYTEEDITWLRQAAPGEVVEVMGR